MHNFRVVYSLTFALCLVVCVYAKTEVTAESAARAAVEQAKASVTAVRARAQSELDKATILLKKVDSSKREAAQASTQAAKTATGNNEAEEIAQQIKHLSDAVNTLYSDAQGKVSTAVSTLTPFVEEAQGLVNAPEIEIKSDTDTQDDYTGTNTKARTLKGKADNLNERITAAIAPVAEVSAKPEEMESKAKEAQLKDAHVSAIIAVAKIESMLGKADTIIGQIEEKKSEVNDVVDQMQTLQRNAPTLSNKNIEALHTNAANELTAAKGAGDNANSAKADIQKQKDQANEALTKFAAEKQEVSKAQGEVRKAEECVRAAQLIVPQLETAMRRATNSVTNAKTLKQKLMKALSTTTTAPSTVQATEAEKANPPVGQGTEPDQRYTTIQPMSKEFPSQIDNSGEKLKDTLINGAQNVLTTALTGGKAPAPGAKNDSAMTVSVPLLVALIASAVLQ